MVSVVIRQRQSAITRTQGGGGRNWRTCAIPTVPKAGMTRLVTRLELQRGVEDEENVCQVDTSCARSQTAGDCHYAVSDGLRERTRRRSGAARQLRVATNKKKLRMARDAATKVVVMMRRHTAPAHAKGGEGLNLCICMVLLTLERRLGKGGEGLNPWLWHPTHSWWRGSRPRVIGVGGDDQRSGDSGMRRIIVKLDVPKPTRGADGLHAAMQCEPRPPPQREHAAVRHHHHQHQHQYHSHHHEQHQQEPQQKHRRHHNGENSGHIFKRSLAKVGGPKTVPTFRARKRTHPEKTYGPVFSGRVRFLARIPGAKQGPLLFKLKYVFFGFVCEIPVGQAPGSHLLHAATSS
jgi:hypothetical protein